MHDADGMSGRSLISHRGPSLLRASHLGYRWQCHDDLPAAVEEPIDGNQHLKVTL
jgi:hypothetical protein